MGDDEKTGPHWTEGDLTLTLWLSSRDGGCLRVSISCGH